MKRALITTAVAALVAGALTGTSSARPAPPTRTVEAEYVTPALGAAPAEGTKAYYYDCRQGIGCAILKLSPKDRFATIEIADTAGRPVAGIVYRVPGFEIIGDFCGTTGDAWSTGGSSELLVHVVSGSCDSGEPSVATTGVVRATVSSRR